MAFNIVDQDVVLQIAILGKILHDRAPLVDDLNVYIDSANGLKERILAMMNEGTAQAQFDALPDLHGMTAQEWLDIAYVITALIKPVLDSNKSQLAPIFKYR